MDDFICERCGKCCVNHATWDELPPVLQCFAQDFYPELEAMYRKVDPKTGWCPNLRMDGKVAVCTIYEKRPHMCVVFRCNKAEARGLWVKNKAPTPDEMARKEGPESGLHRLDETMMKPLWRKVK